MASKKRYEENRTKSFKKNPTQKKDEGLLHLETTYYEKIPKTNDDILLITTSGDRLDNLAYRFYQDSSLWWYIAKANNISFMNLPAGIQIRIPGSTKYAKTKKDLGNIY